MCGLGILVFLISSCLCLHLILSFFNFIRVVWWTPKRIQHLMNSQGVRGPSYRFIYGNSKQILKMRYESLSTPVKDLSHNMFSRIHPHIHSWVDKYGMNFLYWRGAEAQLVISEPEMIREILNDKDKIYLKESIQPYIRKLLGDGLVFSDGEKWSKMRKLANHAFHSQSLKNMIPAMVASVEMMLKRWKDADGNEIEVHGEFQLLTAEVISRTAFGSSYLEGKNIFDKITKLSMLINRNVFKFKLPIISKLMKNRDKIEADKLEKEIKNFIIEIIQKREYQIMGGEADSFENDLLGLLLKAYHNDDRSNRISLQDVIDECKTFYVSGQETTNVLLSWTVLLLAIHTDWQEQARTEVFRILGHQTPNADAIPNLKIMSMVIYETLRLYPPVIGFIRKAKREVQLGKFNLPANINVHISNLAVHHDPCTWGEDVHLFKPERFAEGFAKATNKNTAAFLPFGWGPRTCVGMNFAITEAKIALSMILQRYAFTLSPAYVHAPVQFLSISPQHGIQVMLNAL